MLPIEVERLGPEIDERAGEQAGQVEQRVLTDPEPRVGVVLDPRGVEERRTKHRLQRAERSDTDEAVAPQEGFEPDLLDRRFGLEQRAYRRSGGSGQYLIVGDDARADLLRARNQPLEARRGEPVVRVEQGPPFAAGETQSDVAARARAEIALVANQPQARHRPSLPLHDRAGVVVRCIVHDDDLLRPQGLGRRGADRALYPGSRVSRGDDHRYRRHGTSADHPALAPGRAPEIY